MQLLQSLSQNDPTMRFAMQMASNGDPKQAFLNLAKERGMNTEQIAQMAAQFGVSL